MAYCDDCGLTVCYEQGGPCRTYPQGKPPAQKLLLKVDDEHTRKIWECALRTAADVAAWLAWKRGDR